MSEKAKPYLLLLAAILLEVLATTNLKLSEGFTVLAPSIVVAVGYLSSIGLLTLVLKSVPLGLAYGIWGGAGTVLTVVVGAVMWNDPVTFATIAGVALVAAGIALLNRGTEELEAARAEAAPHGQDEG